MSGGQLTTGNPSHPPTPRYSTFAADSASDIRTISSSPSSHGSSDTAHVNVPAEESSVAAETSSDSPTDPSSSINSTFCPESDTWGDRVNTTLSRRHTSVP